MRRGTTVLFSLALLFATIASAAVLPAVDEKAIATFLAQSKDSDYFARSAFEKDLVQQLQSARDVKKASLALSPTYGLAPQMMEALVRLWIPWVLQREYATFDDVPYEKREDLRKKNEAELRAAFLALTRSSKHARLVVERASEALAYSGSCSRADFDALLEGADDRKAVAGMATSGADCTRWWLAALEIAPSNEAALVRLGSAGSLDLAQKLAALDALRAAPAVLGLDATRRFALQLAVARHFIYELWNGGMVEDGIATLESLPPALREALVNEVQPGGTITFDGFAVDFDSEQKTVAAPAKEKWEYFREELAAAYYVVGREKDARAAFAAIPFATEAQTAMRCVTAESGEKHSECPFGTRTAFRAWYALSLAIARPDSDPYDLAELQFAGGEPGGVNVSSSGLWLRFMRKVLVGPGYAGVLEDAAHDWRVDSRETPNDLPQVFNKVAGSALGARVDVFAKKIEKIRLGMGLPANEPEPEERQVRRADPPGPSAHRFPQHPLGACPPAVKAGKPPQVLANLGEGFGPVRVERAGDIVVAASLSQNLDPVGEVSGGGYWVHISRDGGKSWGVPLYTGLAQYFPYVVVAQSCRPMWAGDHLEIEVEINEIDRESITYPPVGLRAKRHEKGLYLDVPLAELTRDSDGDGITDIEEEHLLLDPKSADSDKDGLKDGVDPLPNVPQGREKRASDEAMRAVLAEIFGKGSFGAIIEGVNPPVSSDPLADYLARPHERDAVSRGRPIFIAGKPEDFASLRPTQMTLVYSREDIARIETMTPVFEAVRFGPLTMNRLGTKGFIAWSAGWTGGTFRVVRNANGWQVEQISGWIT